MLQFFRDRLTGAMVWVFAALIIVPFAFWGIESFRSGGGDLTVAKVGDSKITQSQFHATYQQRYAQLQQMLGERAGQIDTQKLRSEVLDQMVDESALRQFVRQAGYRASDAEILEEIRQIPVFQENGQFSPEAYRSFLARRGQSPQQFETQMRTGMVLDQLHETLLSSAFGVDQAAQLNFRIEHQSRGFDYVKLDPSKLMEAGDPPDTQLHAELDAHPDAYRAPERVKLQYVELAQDQLGEAPAPAADVLKTLYDANKSSMFATPEERHARHILIAFGADKDAAKKKAQALSDQLKQGGDFAAVAKEHTDDVGSRASGGDLGWVRRGNTPAPSFETALFDMKAGDVSAPVESPYGWHVIKLDGIHAADVKPLDDAAVQKQLLELYRQQWSAQTFRESSEKLEQLAFENPSSLDAVAKGLNLTVKTTEWVTHDSHDGLMANPAVVSTAFSPAIVQDGENSKPITISATDLVVIRKMEYEPARTLSYDEVLPKLKDAVRKANALAKARGIADTLVAAVQAGQPLAVAAKAQNLTVQAVGQVTRTQAGIEPALLNGVFRLAPPAAGKVTTGQITLDQDQIAVVALSSVLDGDPQKAPPEELRQIANRLRQGGGGSEFSAYQSAAREQVGVKIVNQPSTSD